MMKVLIIDDSELAREELKHLLSSFKEIQLIGEACDVDSALSEIRIHEPDLLLLDIHMPEKTGFELLEELNDVPQVIFTTAYDQYAIKAFEHNALDYLQKPIKEARFKESIDRAMNKFEQSNGDSGSDILGVENKVFVKEGYDCWFVKVGTIRLLEINGSSTKIYFEKESPTLARSLNQLEEKLDPKVFFRANRQQVINVNFIKHIEPWFSNTLKAYLTTGEEIEISRRQSLKFKDLMSL